MVQFNLPDNSKLVRGENYSLPKETKNKKKISIYRWSPEDDKNPRMDSYEVDLDKAAFKVVNAHLEESNYALALEWLKRLSTELRSLPRHEESWELIPNVKLDPYAS